jgi:Zn-dependent protease with chaperone function
MRSVPDVAGLPSPLGPHDRESFFRAQQRNRRATWRMSMFAALAALVMGVPLTLVITPLFYMATLVVAQIINYFSPLSPEFWATVHQLATLALGVGDYFINQKHIDPQPLAIGIALALVPGMVITLVLWLGMVALFRRGGVGGALASLNARDPNLHDLKELQLANVVEEMAIAAGLPAPRVMLVDSPGANAAAIGASPADARIVVSRRLLDDLDRDELQGVIGHLVASVGNGDLRIAFTVTSVFETGGLLLTLINSPFGPQARSTLWRIARYAFSRPASDVARAAEAEAVAALLTRNLDSGQNGDIDRLLDQTPNKSLWRKFLTFVFFPLIFTNLAIKLTLWFFSFVLLGPCMALLWRTRRYLADASAVQLTRNPDGLANALRDLSADNTAIPGGAWAAHLFVISETKNESGGLQSESMMSFHPALKRRLKRLARMGAHIRLGSPQKKSPVAILILVLLSLIMAPLVLALISMMLLLIGMMIMLNLIFLGMWLAAIQALFTLLAHH